MCCLYPIGKASYPDRRGDEDGENGIGLAGSALGHKDGLLLVSLPPSEPS